MAEPYRARLDPRTGPVLSPGRRPGASGAELVVGLADRVARVAEQQVEQLRHDDHAWLASTLAESRAEWGVTLQERKLAAEGGAPGFKDSLLKDFDEWAGKTSQAAPGGAKRELDMRLKVLRADLMGDALGFETGARAEHAKSQIEGMLATSKTNVFAAPQHYESVLGEQLGILARSALPDPVKAGLERKIRNDMAEAVILARIDRDPAGMRDALSGRRGDAAVSQLKLEDRTRLLGKAESEMRERERDARSERTLALQLEDRATRQAEKAEKAAREEHELDLTVGIVDGKVTARDVMQAGKLRQIGADQARTLLSLSRQEAEGSDDWQVANDLRVRASQGEDVLRDALSARSVGALSNRSLATISDEIAQQRRVGGQLAREDVKAARSQLREVLLEGQSTFTGIKAPVAEKVARADDMFRRRMLEAPDADPVAVRDQILDTFRAGTIDEASLPRSRFLVGAVRAPDIAASLDRVNAALGSGEITQAQYLNEIEALEQIGRFAATLPAPKPAAPAEAPKSGWWFQ